MDKKIFIAVLVLVAFLCSLTLIPSFPAQAQSFQAITINADGTVNPPTAPIQLNGSIYSLTGNIVGNLIIHQNNVTVDGAGYTLQGPGVSGSSDIVRSTGIDLRWTGDYLYNVTVENIRITGFDRGIWIWEAYGINVINNDITNNGFGIDMASCSTNRIVGNNITNTNRAGIRISFATKSNEISYNYMANNNPTGIGIMYTNSQNILSNTFTENYEAIYLSQSSTGNILNNNQLTNNWVGILFDQSGNNVLKQNRLKDNSYSLKVDGDGFVQDIDESNTVNDKPVYYWVNLTFATVPANAGFVALVSCVGITVNNQILTNNQQGVLLAFTTNSTITSNILTNNGFGVYAYASTNNSITGNVITKCGYGIYLEKGANNNFVHENNVTQNNLGGLYLAVSIGNIVSSNNFVNSEGVYFWQASGNVFYYNNFVNTRQIEDVSTGVSYYSPSKSTWDNGVAGNYWSDYVAKYPNASEIDASGIGNIPYVIDENNTDYYPLLSIANSPQILSSPNPTPTPTDQPSSIPITEAPPTTPTPTPSPSPSPTISPTLQPTLKPSVTSKPILENNILVILLIAIPILFLIIGLAFYFWKRKIYPQPKS